MPSLLSMDEKQQLEAVGNCCFSATNRRDYARLDIRQRNGTFYVLDVNPMYLAPDTSLVLSAGLAGTSTASLRG